MRAVVVCAPTEPAIDPTSERVRTSERCVRRRTSCVRVMACLRREYRGVRCAENVSSATVETFPFGAKCVKATTDDAPPEPLLGRSRLFGLGAWQPRSVEQTLDLGQHALGLDRLREIAVAADLERLLAVIGEGVRGERDDQDVARRWVGLEDTRRLPPIHARH